MVVTSEALIWYVQWWQPRSTTSLLSVFCTCVPFQEVNMVSVGVSKLICTNVISVEPGTKINEHFD